MGEKDLQLLLRFFQTAGKLKKEKRKGWVERGVKSPESVADHSWRLALMSMVFAGRQGLDACRCVKMALVHDLAEAECGDIVTRPREELQKVSNREKREKEEKGLKEVLRGMDKEIADEIFSLWEEFDEGKSKEARLVYELDRLEAIFQAVEYEKEGNFTVSLQEFYDYADARIRNKELRQVFGLLMEGREDK